MRTISIYEKPVPALRVVAAHLDVSVDEAEELMRALICAGWGVVPRNPTDGMLAASIEATTPSRHHKGIITAIGKCRIRWDTMFQQGIAVSLSRKFMKP